MITDLLGEFTYRAPGYALNSKKKVFLVNYLTLIQPVKTGGLYHAPVDQITIKKVFESLLREWGVSNLSDWTLIIDARDEWFMPHVSINNVLKDWSTKFKKIVIESNSIFDPTDSKYADIHFHPTACIIINDWYKNLQQENISWNSIKYIKPFIALARRPSKARVLFMKKLFDAGYYPVDLRASCGSMIDNVPSFYRTKPIMLSNPKHSLTSNLSSKSESDHTTQLEEKVNYEELFSPYEWPVYVDGKTASNDIMVHSDGHHIFYTNAVNVICESMELDSQPINLSEKTFKAFAWHQIPLWHASPGTVQSVRDLGFDVFDDIFDHSYDSLPYDKRVESLVSQMHLFKNKYPTIESLNDLRTEIWPRLVANNQRVEYWVEYESNIRNTLYKK